jgi:hypothetical protein
MPRDDSVSVSHSCARMLGDCIATGDDAATQAMEIDAPSACDDIHAGHLRLAVCGPRGGARRHLPGVRAGLECAEGASPGHRRRCPSGAAHPALLGGHSTADLRQLSGYDGLEVLNHRVPPATTQWDAALSSGRAVWAMANDDSSVDT